MVTALLCLVVFVSSAVIDYAHARCIVAISDCAGHRAARWSITQWAGSTIGFIIAVKVTFWVIPFEAAGLYTGTLLAIAKPNQHRHAATLAERLTQPIDLE